MTQSNQSPTVHETNTATFSKQQKIELIPRSPNFNVEKKREPDRGKKRNYTPTLKLGGGGRGESRTDRNLFLKCCNISFVYGCQDIEILFAFLPAGSTAPACLPVCLPVCVCCVFRVRFVTTYLQISFFLPISCFFSLELAVSVSILFPLFFSRFLFYLFLRFRLFSL